MERIEKVLIEIEEEIHASVSDLKKKIKNGEFSDLEESIYESCQGLKTLEKDILVISFLRSSFVTASHKFKMATYEGEAFIERNPPHYFIFLNSLFQLENQELNQFVEKIEKKFANVLASEIEMIRRFYMEKLYQASKELFIRGIQKDAESSKNMKVFFGEEMGEIEEIGEI